MSSMIGGRSGNRGMCAQPCRLPYKFLQNGKDVNKGYLLSPKDMCLVNHIEKLKKIGVTSLKIEGRLKRAEYVSAVVGVYRKCIDEKRLSTTEEYSELLDAFNRSGFTDGYFLKKTGKNMMSYENPSNVSENKFTDEAKNRCKTEQEPKKIPVTIEANLKEYKPLLLKITDIDKNTVTVSGKVLSEVANNKPLTKERLSEQLSKLGQTPFVARDMQVNADDGIVLPISEINAVRRMAVEELTIKRTIVNKRRIVNCNFDVDDIKVDNFDLSAKVKNTLQARVCIAKGIKRIYAPFNVINDLKDFKEKVEFVQIMPSIDKEGKNNIDITGNHLLVNSLGQTQTVIKSIMQITV